MDHVAYLSYGGSTFDYEIQFLLRCEGGRKWLQGLDGVAPGAALFAQGGVVSLGISTSNWFGL